MTRPKAASFLPLQLGTPWKGGYAGINRQGVKVKVLNDEGVASHIGPESCNCIRKGVGEALTGVRASWAIEPRNRGSFEAPTPSPHVSAIPRSSLSRDDPGFARSKNLGKHGSTLCENREVLVLPAADGAAGRVGKSKDRSRR